MAETYINSPDWKKGGTIGPQSDPWDQEPPGFVPLLKRAYSYVTGEPVEPTSWAELAAGAVGRIGVLPGRERIASDIIKRGLKEPWFHGTDNPQAILPSTLFSGQELGGFDPRRIGTAMGTRLGEPSGVSLTRSPEVARTFGDVLRVGVDVPPSSVGQFVDPEFQRVLRRSYEFANKTPLNTPMYAGERLASPKIPATPPQLMSQEAVDWLKRKGYEGENWQFNPKPTFEDLAKSVVDYPEMLPKPLARQFNDAMTKMLQAEGIEAIAYNPKRWGEFELRVLNPKKAVPLGRMPRPAYADSPGSLYEAVKGLKANPDSLNELLKMGGEMPGRSDVAADKYMSLLQRKLRVQLEQAPNFPSRLRDVLPTGED